MFITQQAHCEKRTKCNPLHLQNLCYKAQLQMLNISAHFVTLIHSSQAFWFNNSSNTAQTHSVLHVDFSAYFYLCTTRSHWLSSACWLQCILLFVNNPLTLTQFRMLTSAHTFICAQPHPYHLKHKPVILSRPVPHILSNQPHKLHLPSSSSFPILHFVFFVVLTMKAKYHSVIKR